MKRLLIVTPFSIYPHNHGGKIDMYNSILQLKDAKCDLVIDLLYCDYHENSDVVNQQLKSELALTQIYYLKIKKSRIRSLTYLLKFQPNYCMLYRKLKSLKFEHNYDFVLIHGFHADTILSNPHLANAKFIYRMHNYEFLYNLKKVKFDRNPVIKLLRLSDTYKVKFRELWLLRSVAKVLFISHKEYLLFNKNLGDKAHFLPTYQQSANFYSYLAETKPTTPKVLFVGNLFTGYNLQAVYWYLEFVHPLIKATIPNYTFTIVGNSSGFKLSRLEKFIERDDSIELHTDVAELDNFYHHANVFVNPMQSGAGVKIKTLDAITNGLPLVSTSTGVEGTGLLHGAHCFIYDEALHFARGVIQLIEDPELSASFVAASQDYLRKIFCSTDLIKKIYA